MVQRDLLKVHKIDNFFSFDFEFCTISLLVMLKYEGFVKKQFLILPLWGGGRIIPPSLKTMGNKNCFQPRPKFFYLFKSYMKAVFTCI